MYSVLSIGLSAVAIIAGIVVLASVVAAAWAMMQ